MFRVEITDDDGVDPFFLYLWSVSEDEFHDLKQQQRLLVDFATFPTNLIELLQCCLKDSKSAAAAVQTPQPSTSATDSASTTSDSATASHDSAAAPTGNTREADSNAGVTNPLARSQGPVPLSYLAVLQTCDSEHKSVFSIVETNPFKHLTHLSLQFFPGDDAAIKTYLAARLAQVNAHKRQLATSLLRTTNDLTTTRASASSLQKQLDTLTQQTDAALSTEKLKFADDLNAQREHAAAVLKQREDEFSHKLSALTTKYDDEVRSLSSRRGQIAYLLLCVCV